MRNINKVILIGNLTRDPELRQTPTGQQVCTFGLATNREWVTRDTRKLSSAEFHECVAWAKLAEVCAKYLKKGKLVYVEGYLKTRNWDLPDGTRKFRTEIIVQDMIMLEKRKKEEEGYVPHEEASNAGEEEMEISKKTESSKKPAAEEIKPSESAAPSSVSIEGDLGL